jgi:hypothetical protein
VSHPSTASRAAATPPLSSPARPPSRPPLGRSSRAPERPEAELRRAPESGNGRQSTVDRSLGGPRPVDPTHGFFSSKINPKFCYFRHFALKPLVFSKINLHSIISQSDPRVWKIFTKRSLASEKSTKWLQNFKNSYLFNHNSKSSDSCAKILRITSSSVYAFI